MKNKANVSASTDRSDSSSQSFSWMLPSAFWIPGWNFQSARIEHLPLYFWLVDTARPLLIVDLVSNKPDGYLAFCQSIERLNYGGRCLGIADIFNRRDSVNDRSSLRAYHDTHFNHLSRLEEDLGSLIDSLGSRTIDLLHVDGREVSKISEPNLQALLDRLSPRGLILIDHPDCLEGSWQKVFEERVSFVIGNQGVQLLARARIYDSKLSFLFEGADHLAAAPTIQTAFERLGAGLRERALYRDISAFATRLEISLADQSAIADLLRAEKVDLEAEVQRQTAERTAVDARMALLEVYVEQFRAEVLRLQEFAIKTQNEIEQTRCILNERDLEIDGLQRVIADRDSEIKRIGNHSVKFRREHFSKIDNLEEKIEAGENEISRLLAVARKDESEIARLNQRIVANESETEQLNRSLVNYQGEISKLKQLVVDGENETDRLHQLVAESARSEVEIKGELEQSRQLVVDGENETARLHQLVAESARCEAEIRRELEQSRQNASDLQHYVAHLESTLKQITQSTTWKVTKPFRSLFADFPKSARILRRTIKLLWWTFSFQLFARLKHWQRSGKAASQATASISPTMPLFEKTPSVKDPPNLVSTALVPESSLREGSSLRTATGMSSAIPLFEMIPSTQDHPQDLASTASVPGSASREGSSFYLESSIEMRGDPQQLQSDSDDAQTSQSPADVLALISDIDARLVELASNISLMDNSPTASSTHALTPPSFPDSAVMQPVVERELARVGLIESRVNELVSIINLERHRTDHALLGVDGLLDEIDLYHEARSRPDYKKIFEDDTPLVSICVSTMNRSDLLIERCLNSLIHQSYRNIQIIVIGDHCTDDTGSRVARLRDDRISFHNLSARGPYPSPGSDRWRVAGTNAINAAMSRCEGQFITHLDDDDAAVADRIETLVNAARQHKADFCWHPIWYENKDGSWFKLGDGRFELGQITTGSILYHHYFKKFPWDVFAYRTHEPGDWNRLRKIRSLRPNLHFVDRPLLFHYAEGSQPTFTRFSGELFLE